MRREDDLDRQREQRPQSPDDLLVRDAAPQPVGDPRAAAEVGIVRVTHACLPLPRESATPVVANVGSGLGPFGTLLDPEKDESRYVTPVCSVSKAL